jgi:hypothetical protein
MAVKWKRPWIWLWLAWLALFLVLEFIAIINDEADDTLSENVWGFMSGSSFVTFAVGALLIWLFYHFIWEGRNRK